MRITSKRQVTIPAEIRERAGLLTHTEVAFDGKAVRIVRAKARTKDSWGPVSLPICAVAVMSR
jgi:AbrB family looped-hinge helix DNA binding protein